MKQVVRDKKKLLILISLGFLSLGIGLVIVKKLSQRTTHHAPRATLYHCPMHPQYVSEKPGDCPICNMKLVPVEEAQGTNVVEKRDSPRSGTAPTASVPAVVITAERRQLIGLKTSLIEKRELTFIIRAPGRVAYDPDLYQAISEYQEALLAQGKIKDSPWPDVHERAEALIRASILRLRQMGLSQSQIEEITKSTKAPTNLLLGLVGETVWVYAQIYEYEIGLARPGQQAQITTPAYPGRVFHGEIKAIDPILSAETRSLKVRIEIPNPEGLLKPEMYIDAKIHVALGKKLAIPEAAVLDTGTRQLAFVDLGEGRFEPREIRIGHEAEGFFELLSGVREGERVVTSANFLVDSESKLKAALSGGSKQHSH